MKTLGILLLGLALSISGLRAADPVIVHEWGTFTCLQAANGDAIGGINIDDEPVPDFVYITGQGRVVPLNSNYGTFGLPPYTHEISESGKGFSTADPAVTMRLETPVLYMYPPKGQAASSVPPLDVHVEFHGGYLSQYYPFAEAESACAGGVWDFLGGAVTPASFQMSATTSSLDWKGVRLGSKEKPVKTDSKVWTAPRETSAPLLEVHPMMKDVNGVVHDDAQVEHFLFYRGVGHVDSPVTLYKPTNDGQMIERKLNPGVLGIKANLETGIDHLDAGWAVEIRSDGRCAFHDLSQTNYSGFKCLAATVTVNGYAWFPCFSKVFAEEDFSAGNLDKLKSSMHDALVKEGLCDDEATAMLKTWELSYFKSPGLRFFYIVPRAWVDKVLPLSVTGAPTQITRVMVGRIELITDEQKAALARLAAGPCPDLAALRQSANDALSKGKWSDADKHAFYSGDKPLAELGIPLPQPVRDYLSLGRFRDAIIIHEQREHPSAVLAKFIAANQLTPGGG